MRMQSPPAPPALSSKLPDVGTTIFSVMTALANAHGAINLSQGFPGFDCDEDLKTAVADAMRDGYNQYPPMPGWAPLREILSETAKKLRGAAYDPETEITITSGATEALYATISVVVRPGDEAIILEPAYDCYKPAIELNGGKAVRVKLSPEDFSIDWAAVRAAVTDRTRAVIVNSPHNPTGAVLRPEDLEELKKLAQAHDLFVISDEVYEHIVFDGKPHLSMAADPELRARSFVVGSFGKSLHVTGWKIGYCFAPEEMTREFRKIHQYLTFTTSTPFQVGIANYLQAKGTDALTSIAPLYERKRDLFRSLMADSRFQPLPSGGTYFQLYRYDGISDLPDTEFVKELTIKHGVAAIPVSAFYTAEPPGQKLIRFCFAKNDDELKKAAEILCKI